MKETNERFPSSKPVLWAWLDLNQRPHPYQACSRDAFMLVGEDDQLVGGVDVTVVVRWVPELSVRCGTAGKYDAAWSDAGQQRPTPLLGLLIRRIGLAFSEYDVGDLFSAGRCKS